MLQGEHARRRRKFGVRGALIAATASGALCLPAAPPALAATGPVSPTPVAGTPTLLPTRTIVPSATSASSRPGRR